MLLSGPSSVRENREPVVVEGDTYYKSDWLDSGRDPAYAPTTFLVEQKPHVSLRTHFHRNDQFQLFLEGRGAMGRNPIMSVMVHFATGYSAYGPIVAGEQGLTWLTLRTVWESGSLTMKDHADQMQRVSKRQFHSRSVKVMAADALAASTDVVVNDLIEPQSDGLLARLIVIPPGANAEAPDPAQSAGQYRVVLAGSLVTAERSLGRWEHGFVAPDERILVLEAGPEGVQAVILQFPTKTGAA